MDKQMFKEMLERRGYVFGIQFVEDKGHVLECHINLEEERSMQLNFYNDSFEELNYEEARDRIDDSLGEEMRHVMHSCGQVLLEAGGWWHGHGGYNDFDFGYYLIPLHWGSKPVFSCPQCGEELNFEEGDDSEEKAFESLEEYEEERPTILPRVEDPA